MVTIVPPGNQWSMAGQKLGQGIQQATQGYLQNVTLPMELERQQQALMKNNLSGMIDELKQSGKINPQMEGILNLVKAIGPSDKSGRILSALLPLEMARSQAEISRKSPMAGEQGYTRKALPEFGQVDGQQKLGTQNAGMKEQTNPFFPNNLGGNEAPGQAPQPATEGIAKPLLTPQEKIAAARQLADERTAAGAPTNVKDALKEINENEEDKRLYNAEIKKEKDERVSFQRDYGPKATAMLKKYYPNSTPEQDAIFAKMGEEAAGNMKSEADIDRYLATEAKKFKNTIANVEESLSAPRLQNQWYRRLQGTDKDIAEVSKAVKNKLKLLLDLGLYDTARNLLSKNGFAPEERENIINPLSDIAKTSIKFIPKARKEEYVERVTPTASNPQGIKNYSKYAPESESFLNNSIKETLQKDPNASLVLLRKAYENKGYDWRIFENTINDMINMGEFKPNLDQIEQLIYLDSPPLTDLEKVLHGIGIIGR